MFLRVITVSYYTVITAIPHTLFSLMYGFSRFNYNYAADIFTITVWETLNSVLKVFVASVT